MHMTQSLSLALYRTYAVPSIGELLATTREFRDRTRKRYADSGDPHWVAGGRPARRRSASRVH